MNQKPKILLVDDIASNRLSLRTILKGIDAQLHEASNGFDALSMVLETDFALILLDVQMPEMDGYEVCEQLRADPKTAQIPVIFLTAAYKDDVDKNRGYVAGATDYLAKPIDDHVLRSKVQVFLKLHAQKQLLQDSEFRWRFAIEGSGDGLWDWRVAEGTKFFSARCKEMLGFADDDIGHGLDEWTRLIHPDDHARALTTLQAYLDGQTPMYHSEHRLRCRNGDYKWVLDRGVIVSRSEEPLRMIGTHSDITERKLAEQQLRIAATVFESSEGMFVTDANMVIVCVNQAFSKITGYSAEEAMGQKPCLLRSGRHDDAFFTAMRQSVDHEGSWKGEIWNRRKNGVVFPEWLTITAVKSDDGAVTHYVATLTDITERKAAEDQIKHLAFYDPLTRLANRRLLMDRLHQALATSTRGGHYGALLFLDLDNFKSLNDTHGHVAGDLLLLEAANRLKSCVREMDTVARFGGDEFVVMIHELEVDPAESMALAQLIAEKIRVVIAQPYLLTLQREGKAPATVEHHCSASIGVALFCDHQSRQDDILKWADAAMYQAKAAGRNTIRFHAQKLA
jgi:diguanylate cyclase (GGDEF)-like protein/PAS domain S-box-containing protein